ncbi:MULTISPECIES: hypothetical protein [Vibrio]|jgi:hypothetical protein|uniref:hypothetical protein n=1 Tax=Vibrio TaxID=662 RepID=UPI0003714F8D|nr:MULTISPECIES: hypothetical protein [Vibrio]OEE85865.1 hypothetical protein OAI_00035 [Vibrio cyclitrophicus FF160]CDT49000.1 hypothetical protein VCR15J2_340197 [Vibrio coralliirubri]OBS96766.1 hypothetical protein A9257_10185 [Vibrio cyclitrophicus]OMO30283.1 hypothetical protein BH581_06940 [Vibrio splendidus]PMF18053.1 hypothetical protein BCV20_02860 [Vibrio cyclitrophicus]
MKCNESKGQNIGSLLENIREVVSSVDTELIMDRLCHLGEDYVSWYTSYLVASYGHITPQDIINKYGASALLQYIDMKLEGGYE